MRHHNVPITTFENLDNRLQGNVDQANAAFWNTLAGSVLAESLGVRDFSPESLARFDRGYFDYYPYLLQYVDLTTLSGKKVVEIGLGYGSLGQRMVEAGADYTGLDVAAGPVRLLNHRLRSRNLPGQAIQGSMLQCPLPSGTFDRVISIGCFHHTGDVQRCLDETYRVLRPGGTAVIMVYNLLSYRQWRRWPRQTLRSFWRDLVSSDGMRRGNDEQRLAYDHADEGRKAAPETMFLSIRQLRRMFQRFTDVEVHKENCNGLCYQLNFRIPRNEQRASSRRISMRVDLYWEREKLLRLLGKSLGLDLYAVARK